MPPSTKNTLATSLSASLNTSDFVLLLMAFRTSTSAIDAYDYMHTSINYYFFPNEYNAERMVVLA